MSPFLLLIPIGIVTIAAVTKLSNATIARSRSQVLDSQRRGEFPKIAQPSWMAPPVKPYNLSLQSTFKEGVEYPDTMRALAEKWAPIFEVPAAWLISQAYVESQNRPLAQNPSGATGILQIKLIRALDLVKWIGRSKWKTYPQVKEMLSRHWHGQRADLLNPDLNTMLAAFDLNHLRKRFGNDHNIVAAAYNQGEGRISRHLKDQLPLPPRAIEYVARVEKAKRRGYV